MSGLTQVIRWDRGSVVQVTKPTFTEDGFMRISGRAARVGVQQYQNADGSIRNELRLPEDVFAQKSLDSYTGRPFTNDHPCVAVLPSNATKHMKGAVIGAAADGDHVAFDAMVHDEDTQLDIKNGKRELSAGYRVSIDRTSGVHPLYGRYDVIQRNILVNHLALVDMGRAGPMAKIQMDSMQGMRMDGLDFAIAIADATISTDDARERAFAFAVTRGSQLPISDEEGVRASMKKFGAFEFASPAEKRTAFNRIVARAKELKIDPSGFVDAWGDKLDESITNKKRMPMPTDKDKKPELTADDHAAALKLYADEKLRADTLQRELDESKTAAAKAEGRADELAKKLQDEKDNRIDTAALEQKDASIKTLTTERDDARKQVTALSDPKVLEKATMFRSKVIAKSDSILNADAGKPIDLHLMTNKDIMMETIRKRRGEDMTGRDDAYIESRWETTVEDHEAGENAMARVREAGENLAEKKKPQARNDAKSARDTYLEKQQNRSKAAGKPAGTKGA